MFIKKTFITVFMLINSGTSYPYKTHENVFEL